MLFLFVLSASVTALLPSWLSDCFCSLLNDSVTASALPPTCFSDYYCSLLSASVTAAVLPPFFLVTATDFPPSYFYVCSFSLRLPSSVTANYYSPSFLL